MEAVRALTVWEEPHIKGSKQRKPLATQDLSVQGQRGPHNSKETQGLLRRTAPRHQRGLNDEPHDWLTEGGGNASSRKWWAKVFP